MRRAFPITSDWPARIAPSGQPRPFERQSVTVSKRLPISAASIPVATAALSSRAPSRWKRRSSSSADRVQLADLLERPDPAAAGVVRVLDPEDARARRVDRRHAVGGTSLVGAVAPGDARQAAGDDARVNGRSAELGDEDVAVLLADELVAELGVQAQRDLVRHRRGREEDRLVLSEQPRRTLLELVDRRVLTLLLVADGRRGDRGPHARSGARGGVGTKVDHRLRTSHAPNCGGGRLARGSSSRLLRASARDLRPKPARTPRRPARGASRPRCAQPGRRRCDPSPAPTTRTDAHRGPEPASRRLPRHRPSRARARPGPRPPAAALSVASSSRSKPHALGEACRTAGRSSPSATSAAPRFACTFARP